VATNRNRSLVAMMTDTQAVVSATGKFLLLMRWTSVHYSASPMRTAITRAILIFIGVCLAACTKVHAPNSRHAETGAIHRVVVAYPEQWAVGEYRNCYLGATDVVHNLPTLDCDIHTHETPRSQTFVMDVEFSGNYDTATSVVVEWTCQKTKETLFCRR